MVGMRVVSWMLAAVALVVGPSAMAQGPVPGMMPPGPAAQDQGPPPAAGQVPSLSQQPESLAPGQGGGTDPSRAPGSKADQGTNLPTSSDNAGTTTVYAPSAEDKEAAWPCAQPRVPRIGAGTMWSGPDVALGKDWQDDNATAELAQKLASRRTSLDEASDLIKEFAAKAGADKDKKLTELFVGTLDIINDNRSEILDGIMRYARGQERLARRITDESDRISEAQDNATAHGLGIAKDQTDTDFAWDQRIFKERRQALSYVCETPSLLERRAFEVAKRIQAQT